MSAFSTSVPRLLICHTPEVEPPSVAGFGSSVISGVYIVAVPFFTVYEPEFSMLASARSLAPLPRLVTPSLTTFVGSSTPPNCWNTPLRPTTKLWTTVSVVPTPITSTPVPASPTFRLLRMSSRLPVPSMSTTPAPPAFSPMSPFCAVTVAPEKIDRSAEDASPTVSWPVSVRALAVPLTEMSALPVDCSALSSEVPLTVPPALIESDPSPASPTSSVPPTRQSEPAPVTLTEEPEAPDWSAIVPALLTTVPSPWIARPPTPASPTTRLPALFQVVSVPDTVTAAARAPVPEMTSTLPSLAMLAPPSTVSMPLPTVMPVSDVNAAPDPSVHSPPLPNWSTATVPVPVTIPPVARNSAVVNKPGGAGAGFTESVTSSQFAAVAKLVSCAPVQT